METNYLFLQLAASNRDAFLCLHWMIHSDLNKNKNSSEKTQDWTEKATNVKGKTWKDLQKVYRTIAKDQ